jgi:hypothetical protein
MRGPVLPGEPWPTKPATAALGIHQGGVWLRVGGQREVFDLAMQLPPDSPLRAQLLGTLPLIGS